MLELYLIRHAQTVPNVEKRYPELGEDAPLSPAGEAQAARLKLPPGTVHSSPAARCIQTARLAGYPNVQMVPELREADFGVMAGHTWAELEAEYGAAPLGWISALGEPENPLGPPGGESGADFHARVARWLDTLPVSGTVLAFTHLGPLLAALRLGVGLRAAEGPPGTVVHLRRSGGNWWLAEFKPGAS